MFHSKKFLPFLRSHKAPPIKKTVISLISYLRVTHRLDGHVLLLYVKGLVAQHLPLHLVLLALLEDAQGLLLHRVLARALAHLAHLVLVLGQLLVQFADLLFDAVGAAVNVLDALVEVRRRRLGLLGAEDAIHLCTLFVENLKNVIS